MSWQVDHARKQYLQWIFKSTFKREKQFPNGESSYRKKYGSDLIKPIYMEQSY